MTIDLDKLKELVAKATSGPWHHEQILSADGVFVVRDGIRSPLSEVCHDVGNDHDAALIVALVNAAPALIAKAERVDALTEVVERAQQILSKNYQNWHLAARNALSNKGGRDGE